jgi:AIG2-like family
MIYFAYGADMNPGRMAEICPGYHALGVARLPDHRLSFSRFSRTWGCASASLAPRRGETVFGVLYNVPDEESYVLHSQHGFDPDGAPEFNDQEFRNVTVLRVGGSEPVTAGTYIAVPDGTTALPSATYMNLLIDGARYHNLPRAYLVVLRAVPTA